MGNFLEKHIVELLSEKNDKAISLLYDHYADTLYGVALKIIRNEELAQDVIQESFVKIWKNADSYDSKKAKLFTWIFRIVRNTAIDKLRSTSSKTEKEIQIDVSDVYSVGEANYKPEHMDVAAHINSLDKKYQVVIEALFFKGLTQQEASEALNIPLGTIKSRLKIGLRELRKIYGSISLLIALL